jgi:hypothetical protein
MIVKLGLAAAAMGVVTDVIQVVKIVSTAHVRTAIESAGPETAIEVAGEGEEEVRTATATVIAIVSGTATATATATATVSGTEEGVEGGVAAAPAEALRETATGIGSATAARTGAGTGAWTESGIGTVVRTRGREIGAAGSAVARTSGTMITVIETAESSAPTRALSLLARNRVAALSAAWNARRWTGGWPAERIARAAMVTGGSPRHAARGGSMAVAAAVAAVAVAAAAVVVAMRPQ